MEKNVIHQRLKQQTLCSPSWRLKSEIRVPAGMVGFLVKVLIRSL